MESVARDEMPAARGLLGFYDAHRRAMLAIVAALYVAGFNGQWRLEPDSALYLSLGRNLARGLGYTYLGEVHTLAYPGWPWALAGMFRAFGENRLWPEHLFMLACGLGALAMFHRLMLYVAGRPTAVLLTCIAGTTETVFRYAFEMRNDTPFFLGVMAFLAGYEAMRTPTDGAASRWRWWDAALLIGGMALALAMRPAVAALIGAVGVAAVWQVIRRPGGWWRPAVAIAVVVAVALVFHRLDPRRAGGDEMGQYEESMVDAATTQLGAMVRTAATTNLWRLLNAEIARSTFGTKLVWWPINVIGSLAVIAAGVWLFRVRVIWGAFFALTLVMVALVPRPEGRYLLPVMPLVAYGWWLMCQAVGRAIGGRAGQRVFVAMVALWVLPNVARVAWVVAEQRSLPFLVHYRDGDYAAMPRLSAAIAANVDDGAAVAAPLRTGRVLAYLSDRTVVDGPAIARFDGPGRRWWVVLPEKEDFVRGLIERDGLRSGSPSASVRDRRRTWTLSPTLAGDGEAAK